MLEYFVHKNNGGKLSTPSGLNLSHSVHTPSVSTFVILILNGKYPLKESIQD